MDLDALIARLRETIARYGLPIVLHLIYPDGRTELITLPTNSVPGNMSCEKPTPVTPKRSEREKTVLAAMEKIEKPLKGQAIARRAGLSYNPNFRRLMSGLMEKGLVIPGPQGGYWLASRPLPEA